MTSPVPIVSICATTYNLEKYIGVALDSWLSQTTSFPYEIIICDDCSQDQTVSIINAYVQRYPEKIRLFTSEQNLGMMPNYIRSLQKANGKYIAVCDGDDYWIDPYKLQTQIDFLESHHDFIACLTNSYVIDENTGIRKIAKTQIWNIATSEELLLHDDFHKDNINLSPGHISTYVFRNHILNKFPNWFFDDDVVTDYPLYMMLSQYGKTKFINKITSVYLKREGSHSFSWYSYRKIHKSRIKMHKCINAYLNFRYKSPLNLIIAKHYICLAKSYYKERHITKTLYYLLLACLHNTNVTLKYLFFHKQLDS